MANFLFGLRLPPFGFCCVLGGQIPVLKKWPNGQVVRMGNGFKENTNHEQICLFNQKQLPLSVMKKIVLPRLLPVCAAALAAALLAVPEISAATYYWDTNNSTSGFGTAGGTWAAPTTNNSTQGWSTSATGVNAMSGTTNTTTSDALNFGTGTASYGLAAGTITVSGTVAANSLTIGSQSGAIVLSGGEISLGGTTPTITVNNASDTISSVISGSAAMHANIYYN